MDRKQFLEDLARLWKHDNTLKFDLTLEDLLDDCATLRLPGAARLYVKIISEPLDNQQN